MAVVQDLSGNNPTAQKLCSHNRTAATTAAVMALTPLYPGEIALALDSGIRFRGLELVVGRWGQIFGDIP